VSVEGWTAEVECDGAIEEREDSGEVDKGA
jgi:hypothetical protein